MTVSIAKHNCIYIIIDDVQLNSGTVDAGNSYNFTCTVSACSSLPLLYQWTNFTSNSPSVAISPVSPTDAGIYICTALVTYPNSTVVHYSSTATLTVRGIIVV